MLCERCKHQISTVDPSSEQSVSAQIMQMKLRAGLETDSALGEFVGRAQNSVSMWRKRGRIPNAIVVRFEKRMAAAR